MKRTMILLFSFWATITIQVTQQELDTVEDSVISAEVWLENAWKGKVNKCESRIIKKEIDLSIKDNEVIPAGRDAIIQKHLNRLDYKNREDREKELGSLIK